MRSVVGNFFVFTLCMGIFHAPDFSEAATLSAFASSDGCGETNFASTGIAQATCTFASSFGGSLGFATASFGSIGANAGAIASPNAVAGQASAALEDQLTISGMSSGFISFRVLIDGDISVIAGGQFSGSEPQQGRVEASWSISTIDASQSQSESISQTLTNGPGGLVSQSVGSFTIGSPIDVVLGFESNVIGFSAQISARAFCGSNPDGCTAQSYFGSTLNFVGATVLDIYRNPVSGLTITSQSGFDYIKGVSTTPPSPVPIPESFMLALVGIGSLLALRRRKVLPAGNSYEHPSA